MHFVEAPRAVCVGALPWRKHYEHALLATRKALDSAVDLGTETRDR